MSETRMRQTTTGYRAPNLQAAAASGVALLLYVVTLAPTTWFWDTSEYITTAHILGIPHPPGNPLFVILGRVWEVLLSPTGLSVAVRINLLAAVTSAMSTGLLFLVAHRVLRSWLQQGEGREGSAPPSGALDLALLGAWCAAILAATSFTVWNQSNVNEKVYTVSMFTIALVSWLAFRWLDRSDEPGSWRLLVLAGYVMVLGSTNHLMSVLPAPALLALVLVRRPRAFLDPNLLSRGAVAVVLGLAFNFVVPIRAADQPIVNEGEPICDSLGGAAVAVYSLGRAGCPALADNLSREQYGKPSMFRDPTWEYPTVAEPVAPPRDAALIGHQLLNWFQYFDWQWARGVSPSELPGNARLPFTLVFLGLGVWGLAVTRKSGRGEAVYLGVLTLTLTVGLVTYLNFKYGFSLGPALGETETEVRERDYFFVASFHLWGILAGMGLVACWRWAAGGSLARRNLALASPVLALALVPLAFNWGWASKRGDYSALDWAYDMLQSVEPYAILFTNGDNDTFPLWYLQEVEGIRQDVTVVVGQYLYTPWYPPQLAFHSDPVRQRPYRDDEGLGLYEAPASMPTRPVTAVSRSDMNLIESTILPNDLTIDLVSPEGSVSLQYPAGTQLLRGQQIALLFIRDSVGERPIHFASTGAMAEELGLEAFTVRQGFTTRLRLDDFEGEPGIVRVFEDTRPEWIDLGISLRLAQDVFRYRGLEARRVWADRASLNIPVHYYVLFLELAEAAVRTGGSPELVRDLVARSEGFWTTAQGGSAYVSPGRLSAGGP